jgi:hypothetical protein
MKREVQIILVQTTKTDRDTGHKTHSFRIAKLIGGVSVFAGSKEFHVGDFVDSKTAESFTRAACYKVTVTEKAEH